MSATIDLAIGEYVVDDVSKGKCCGPVYSVIAAKKHRDVACDGAEAPNVEICAFAPTAYPDIFKAVGVLFFDYNF